MTRTSRTTSGFRLGVRRLLPWVAGVALAAAALFGWSFLRRAPDRPLNLVVITLDTIRADRLPAYGGRTLRTPAIDALAARGVLFERAVAPVPLTLPSHTTVFSGMYPLTHGVRDNGSQMVPRDVPLLADLARSAGYRTGAFVGAFVLDGRWGLNRGFETYFDDFDLHQPDLVSIGDIRRPANEVIDRAIEWLRQDREKPLLLWAHLYDPHAPYDPPSPYREQYPSDPYLAEIAFADAQIGRLLDAIDEAGLRDRTAIVLAGDHGESFGEHGESGHGYFVYEPTLRVPLVIAVPGAPQGIRRGELVSLVDLLPTMCGWLNVPAPTPQTGQSLGPLLGGRGAWVPEAVYAESVYARLHFGWSELASYTDHRFKLVDSSEAELYDLQADPGEQQNLAGAQPERVTSMRRQLGALVQALSKPRAPWQAAVDLEAQERLSSLGYVTGSAPPAADASGRLPAPAEKIAIYNELIRSRELAEDGDLTGAAQSLERLVRDEPGVIDAWAALGAIRLKLEEVEGALIAFREGLQRKPDEPVLAVGLAQAQMKARLVEDALKTLLAAKERMPLEARITFLLGAAELQRQQPDAAARYFDETLRLNPKAAAAHAELADVAVLRRDFATAIERARRALALDPRVSGAHLYTGRALESEGRLDEAAEEYRQELAIHPGDPRPAHALTAIAERTGEPGARERMLREVIAAAPRFVPPYLSLARLYLDGGSRFNEGIDLATKALSLQPQGDDLALGCFLLADLYNRVGDGRRSLEYARKGEQASRRPAQKKDGQT